MPHSSNKPCTGSLPQLYRALCSARSTVTVGSNIFFSQMCIMYNLLLLFLRSSHSMLMINCGQGCKTKGQEEGISLVPCCHHRCLTNYALYSLWCCAIAVGLAFVTAGLSNVPFMSGALLSFIWGFIKRNDYALQKKWNRGKEIL